MCNGIQKTVVIQLRLSNNSKCNRWNSQNMTCYLMHCGMLFIITFTLTVKLDGEVASEDS